VGRQIPPAPLGWNKTLSDLLAEVKSGRRRSIQSPEADWALDYARSLLPENMRFPHQGDVYEALEDVRIDYMTMWSKPFSDGGDALFPRGERVSIPFEPPDPRPLRVYANPLDYPRIENLMVPVAIRNDASYAGFHLSISTLTLSNSFRLVDSKASDGTLSPA
jgi:hypothetical protein